ncbi:MAG: TIGR01212 family radical SAM protein [Candidatus Methylomirabilis sp.]|nr:TIGR01212 family radical SAM protein [Deltaproteobacteria bacterium]
MSELYNPLSSHLKSVFGCKVFKVSIDIGLPCPNRRGGARGGCSFCVESTLVPKTFEAGMGVREQLISGIEYVGKRYKAERFIAYFQQGTNTNAPVGVLRGYFREALIPEVAAIAVGTRPDCLDDATFGLLSELNEERPLWLELGLQSANDRTLSRINRGHTAEDFRGAVIRAAARGIKVCAHVIIGLPGEREADYLKTIDFLAGLPVWGVKFHQLQIVKGSHMEKEWRRGEIVTLSLDEYADAVVRCLERLPQDVVIHRLCGDVPSELLSSPVWGANKFKVIEKITGLLRERNTRQGAKTTGAP